MSFKCNLNAGRRRRRECKFRSEIVVVDVPMCFVGETRTRRFVHAPFGEMSPNNNGCFISFQMYRKYTFFYRATRRGQHGVGRVGQPFRNYSNVKIVLGIGSAAVFFLTWTLDASHST